MITQAFVLGAGLGTRLRPLTDELPKPLIPIFQKPLITFALDHLIEAGCENFSINTHHQPERFSEILGETYRSRSIEFHHESELLETGGGIKNVEASLGTTPFIVYSGDILTDIDLGPLIEEHFRAGNDVTLALRETGLGTDVAFRNGRVLDIGNQHGHTGRFDYANVSVWNANAFTRIPPRRKISFIPILAQWIGEGGKIGGVIADGGEWFNIGSRAQYLEVHRTIAQKKWKPSYVTTSNWPVLIAPDAVVDPTARLAGFYSIGAGAQVGADAIVENTILWPGAQIASGSRLCNCIVRSHQKAKGELRDTDI